MYGAGSNIFQLNLGFDKTKDTEGKRPESKDGKNAVGLAKDSALAQAGIYGMYGFDGGHWLYANPKSTYHAEGQTFTNQIEVGGGYMVADKISVGFKVEHTAKIKGSEKNGLGVGNDTKADTVTWLQANYYF